VKKMEQLLNLQLFAVPVQQTQGAGGNTLGYTVTDRDTEVNFGKLLEPGLRRIFFEAYDELPEQYSRIYNVQTSDKAREIEWGMGAFGDWTKRTTQLDNVDYKTLSPGLQRTYIHDAFTQGFMVTREMYDDDQYRQMNKMPKALARAGRQKVERDALLPLVNGFSADVGGVGKSAIYDGKALFATDHPLLDKAGVVNSNKLTGVLNDANLKTAIKMMRETKDEAGNLIQFVPTKLIVPPALEDTAIRLLKSDLITGSANNDTNSYLKGKGIDIVVMDYLGTAGGGSDTAWFLQDGSRHELNFFWRKRPEFKWAEEFDNFVAKYRGYMRYSFGVSDWRGLVGSSGTTA
jgi:phage major head subunit gpT-like protein